MKPMMVAQVMVRRDFIASDGREGVSEWSDPLIRKCVGIMGVFAVESSQVRRKTVHRTAVRDGLFSVS